MTVAPIPESIKNKKLKYNTIFDKCKMIQHTLTDTIKKDESVKQKKEWK